MQHIPDEWARAAPQDRQQEPEAHDKPLAMSYQLVVLFVARARADPAGNHEVGALFEQRAELEHGLRIDRALGMKEDERVGGAVVERAPVRAVVSRQVLVVNGDSARAQVLDCSIGAAAINRKHLIELVEGQQGHVMLAAGELVPREQTQRQSHQAPTTPRPRRSASHASTSASSSRPTTPRSISAS